MRRTPALGLAPALLIALALASTASASPVLTLRPDGRAVVRTDPYLPPLVAEPRQTAPPATRAAAPVRSHDPRAAAKRRTVRGELKRLLRAGAITQAAHDEYRGILFAAQTTRAKLGGTRRSALGATISNLEQIAASGLLTGSRLPALFETVERNRAWWASGPLLANGARVSFQGSPLVWQYYAGQGIQIQWLGTFGKANALWSATKQDAALRTLLDETLRLASDRAGGIAWEYLFHFGGGRPPWASGLAQSTGIQALTRAGVKLDEPRYIQSARRALGIFREAPPSGVRIKTSAGAHYLIYSYAPGERVLNAFTQALNGLYDFASLANDAEGRVLFAQGDAQLRRELSSYDTGAWSRYSPGIDADLSYHTLARDFLRGLCARLTAQGTTPPAGSTSGGGAVPAPPLTPVLPGADPSPYCAAAQRFTSYLTRKPKLELISRSVRAGRAAALRISLDKPSFVKIALLRAGRTVRVLSARLSGGRRSLLWYPSSAGTYGVMLRATDLAGNVGASKSELQVLKQRKHGR
ncbi:MAG: D-glucuronyl C5-epimerase family protein [Actinobacteria bacterium]|nr:D-glucuronyl C5-epimerase family protein [Actinomycetota bacterium]